MTYKERMEIRALSKELYVSPNKAFKVLSRDRIVEDESKKAKKHHKVSKIQHVTHFTTETLKTFMQEKLAERQKKLDELKASIPSDSK